MLNHVIGIKRVLAIITLVICGNTVAAPVSYTSVRAQIDDFDSVGGFAVASLGSTFADISHLGLYAKARSSFGNNGALATSNSASQFGAFAESVWVDAFNISGGIGIANLAISVLINGTTVGAGQPGGPGANAYYLLYVSNSPISCNFDAVTCSGTQVIFTDGISGSQVLNALVPFTYGQTFYLASYLGAEVRSAAGVADFYNSAHFGATAPDGSAIVGDSGTTYARAATVPEPSSLAVLFSGLLPLLFTIRRNRGRSTPG